MAQSQATVAPATPNKASDFRILVRCFGYLRPYWKETAAAYGTLLLITGLSLLIPQFIRWIVDHGIEQQNLRLLAGSVAGLLGLALARGILTFLQGRWTEVASQSVAYDLRNEIHHKLADLSFAFHDRSETGQLLSRAVQDVDRVRFLTGRAVLRLVDGAVLMVGTAIVMIAMNPSLALLSLAALPLLAHRAFLFGRQTRPLSLMVQQQLAVLTTRLEQNLRGARIVKAFAQEAMELRRFQADNDAWFDVSAQAASVRAHNVPLLDLISNVSTVIIIWYGGLLAIRGQLSLGELVAFTAYLGQLIQPVRRLGMIIPAVAMAIAAGERIFDILDTRSEVGETPGAAPLPPVRGHVRFEHVSFGYTRRHRVLDDIDFEVQPGQVVALLGATGSGKSSIINLLPRFYDPTAGRILVDGHDIRSVTLDSLRDQIAIVLQETTLFAASVYENIAFGRPDADEAAVTAAAQAAQAHDFIVQMPDGYRTEVGERGVTLSGGQKQRIAIARALLKDPRILILDDATSSVDTETERQIQTALANLMRGRTSFVIAQRLSTVRTADLILVLERGRIGAAGRHADLLRKSELYARIYHGQLAPARSADVAEVEPQP